MAAQTGAAMLRVVEIALGRALALAENGADLLLRLVKQDGVIPEQSPVEADPTSPDEAKQPKQLA